MSRRFAGPNALITVMVALVLAGCCNLAPPVPEVKVAPASPPVSVEKVPAPEDQLAVFSAQLAGIKKAATGSPSKSASGNTGTGSLVAVYNPDTGLFRWKLTFAGLKGIPKTGQFHGREGPDTGGTSTLPFSGAMKSPMEGRANLTEAQAADLLAGKWYVSIRTSVFPNGEVRGQLVLHE